jgi:hypothetical protein
MDGGPKTAAPRRYDAALARRICARIARGDSWGAISLEPGAPDFATLYQWVRKRPEFGTLWLEAREASQAAMLHRLREVAEAAEPETAAQAKLRMEVLSWRAERAAGVRRQAPRREIIIERMRFE